MNGPRIALDIDRESVLERFYQIAVNVGVEVEAIEALAD